MWVHLCCVECNCHCEFVAKNICEYFRHACYLFDFIVLKSNALYIIYNFTSALFGQRVTILWSLYWMAQFPLFSSEYRKNVSRYPAAEGQCFKIKVNGGLYIYLKWCLNQWKKGIWNNGTLNYWIKGENIINYTLLNVSRHRAIISMLSLFIVR